MRQAAAVWQKRQNTASLVAKDQRAGPAAVRREPANAPASQKTHIIKEMNTFFSFEKLFKEIPDGTVEIGVDGILNAWTEY
jgi:hypothetical protein